MGFQRAGKMQTPSRKLGPENICFPYRTKTVAAMGTLVLEGLCLVASLL